MSGAQQLVTTLADGAGPKEPSGFWRPFHAKRKPRFIASN